MNPYKNEKLIKLGVVEVLLRPDFDNIAALEANVEPLMGITMRMARAKVGAPLTLLAQIIYYCQAERKENNQELRRYSLEEIWQLVQSQGASITLPVMEFVGGILSGDKNQVELSETQKKS